MEQSDKRLWTGWLKKGDEHAFEALVRPHMAFALDFARRLGCKPDQADDVLQTCLARLAAEQDNRPVRVGIRAWLGRSVSLEARMLKRSEGRRARREQAWQPIVSEHRSIDDRMAAVERGIDRLTPVQREAVWLRYRHDLDYPQIAQILGVSENACRLRVHKAMVSLRERLGRDAGSLIATLPLLTGGGRAGTLVAAALGAAAAHSAPTVTTSLLPALAALVLISLASAFTWYSIEDDGQENEVAPLEAVSVEEALGPAAPLAPGSSPATSPVAPPGTETTRPPRRSANAAAAADSTPSLAARRWRPRPGKMDARAQPRRPRAPLLPAVLRDHPKACRALVEAARLYLDLEHEQWRGRTAFVSALTAEAKAGRHWLKDMDALRWLIYQSRSFNADMRDRNWQRTSGVKGKRLDHNVYALTSEDLTLTFSMPKTYPGPAPLRKEFPRVDPYPVVLSMHEKRDYTGQKFPGDVLFKRRYPKAQWKALHEKWILFAPIAAAGNFVGQNGMIRSRVFRNPLAVFWKHYHIDFDRIVLDGGEQAFAAAASLPVFFAGIIFRGDKWKLETVAQKEAVKNFASVPVYVVDNPALARQLEEAGHRSVAAGTAGLTLYNWMKARKRVMPRKFEWTAEKHDQVLPYWVSLDSPNWAAPARTLKVEVVDTEVEPNCIRIDAPASGIKALSLYLNDELVDLDRKVRVIINGHIEYEELLEPKSLSLAVLGRDFDFLFNREPARIRLSRFFGWLYPARIVNLPVNQPEKKAVPNAPGAEGPKASAEEDEKAGRYLLGAKTLHAKGRFDAAIGRLEKVLALPSNTSTAEAARLLAEWKKEKAAGPK